MTERRNFYRKLGYMIAIAVLWFPIYEISHPASIDADGNHLPGGKFGAIARRTSTERCRAG